MPRSGSSLGTQVYPTDVSGPSERPDGTIAPPMLKSLVRTLRGPSRDPRMAYVSRPMPRDLPDEQVIQALEMALGADPNPSPPRRDAASGAQAGHGSRSAGAGPVRARRYRRLHEGAGHDPRWRRRQLARLRRDVVSASAAIRGRRAARAAIIAADTASSDQAPPSGPKPGWEPPPPPAAGSGPQNSARPVARAGLPSARAAASNSRELRLIRGARRPRTRSCSCSTARTAATGSRSTTFDHPWIAPHSMTLRLRSSLTFTMLSRSVSSSKGSSGDAAVDPKRR